MALPKPSLATWKADTVAKSIMAYYWRDVPAPDDVLVPLSNIQALDKRESLFRATVSLLVKCNRIKTHTINIKFRVSNYRVIPSTINYI